MACPTCDHTMQRFDSGYFWCPRCGTLKSDDEISIQRPMVVNRCREFASTLGDYWKQLWRRLGIEESIYLPSERS